MRLSLRTSLLSVALLAAPVTQARAQATQTVFSYSGSGNTILLVNGTTSFSSFVRGWYDQAGNPNGAGASNNYIAGRCGPVACSGNGNIYNNWFAFDLSNFSGTVTSAQLLLDNGSNGFFNELGSSLNYSVFDIVGTAFSALGTSIGVGIYNDLGTGVMFGTTNVTAADNGGVVTVNLNAAGLASLNNARQRGVWAVGGSTALGNSNVVPEPSTYALMAAGLAAMLAVGRARRRMS